MTILGALRQFVRLPNVSLENDFAAIHAFDLMEKGMDDADAFHLATSIGCEAMISFDAAFRKIAKRDGALEVREPN
jgi:predicted nucleic acid-binding protein